MMQTLYKRVVGIDITQNAVSFVQIQKTRRRVKILRSGVIPLETDIVSNGIVQRPAELVKILKRQKIAGTFLHNDAVLTVCAEPTLLQILDPPVSSPAEIRKFIHSEIKQYAILPFKGVEVDYCSLRSADIQTKRVLIAATQGENLMPVVKAIERNNVDVQAIEPAIIAFIRACSGKLIKNSGDRVLMFLLLRDDVLNLCVFEKRRFEFVRVKRLYENVAAFQELMKWLKAEVESVIRFYEFEKEVRPSGWQIVIACCPNHQFNYQMANELKSQIARSDIEVIAYDNNLIGLEDTGINGTIPEDVSPVAFGAAMRLLGGVADDLKLNLLPQKIVSTRKIQNEMLAVANMAACLLVVLLFIVAFLAKKSVQANREISIIRQKHLSTKVLALANIKMRTRDKAKIMESSFTDVSNVIESKKWFNWAKLLAELSSLAPRAILIQTLDGQGNGTIRISGLAVNFEAVSNFLNRLQQSGQIASATLVSAGQSTKDSGGLVDYVIVCTLVSKAVEK